MCEYTSYPARTETTLPIQPELKVQPQPKGQPSRPPKSDQLAREYSDVFQGIGKLKDFQLDLYISKDVRPVTQAERRIPFHLRSKVEAKLENLQSQGIIERLSGQTPWVSPIVVAPKPHDKEKIRLYVDTRAVNIAIEREHHSMPTLDKLFSVVCVFPKLDLRSAYRQIELAPSSRYVTVFATQKGLFQYRWLLFGINPPMARGGGCHGFFKFFSGTGRAFLQSKFLAVGSSLGHLSMKKFFRSDLPSWS